MKTPNKKFQRCCLRIAHAGPHMFIDTSNPAPMAGECQARPGTNSDVLSPEITAATPWGRLQALSCAHANAIYAAGTRGTLRGGRRVVYVPEVIEDNVKILGRADEEEMKSRVIWYITFHPAIFDACSKVWNRSAESPAAAAGMIELRGPGEDIDPGDFTHHTDSAPTS